MRIGTMFGDVLESFFRKPATRIYPVIRHEPPVQYRGKLIWNPEKCTGCSLCAKDCPSNAIKMIVLDKAKKQFVLRYYIDRCTFCAQCVQNCRFKCMDMQHDQWELAALDKESFTIYYGDPNNIKTVLAGPTAEETGTAP